MSPECGTIEFCVPLFTFVYVPLFRFPHPSPQGGGTPYSAFLRCWIIMYVSMVYSDSWNQRKLSARCAVIAS